MSCFSRIVFVKYEKGEKQDMKTFRTDSQGNRLWVGEQERKDGRYSYRYYDRYGKAAYVYARSLRQLRIEEANIAGRERINILKNVEGVTLNDQFELWIAGKKNLRKNTLYDYRYAYDAYVRNSLGKKYIDEICTYDIKCHYMSLNISQRISVETIAHVQNIVFQVFQSAKECNLIMNNPAERAAKDFVRKHSKHTSNVPALGTRQARVFLDFLKNSDEYCRWYPLFYIMVHTGLRLGEVTSLRWCDVNLEKGYLDVNHAVSYVARRKGQDNKKVKASGNAFYEINTPKTDAGIRKIPLSPIAIEALKMEKRYQEEEGVSCMTEINGYTDFVFLNRFGNIYTQSPVNRALKRAVMAYNQEPSLDDNGDKIFIPLITSHSLRHTFACILCEKNVNIKVMQVLLGHSDIQTTIMIYTRISEEFVTNEYRDKIVQGELWG